MLRFHPAAHPCAGLLVWDVIEAAAIRLRACSWVSASDERSGGLHEAGITGRNCDVCSLHTHAECCTVQSCHTLNVQVCDCVILGCSSAMLAERRGERRKCHAGRTMTRHKNTIFNVATAHPSLISGTGLSNAGLHSSGLGTVLSQRLIH